MMSPERVKMSWKEVSGSMARGEGIWMSSRRIALLLLTVHRCGTAALVVAMVVGFVAALNRG